jgi:hypothetical protein
MSDFYKMIETPLDRAVDKAVAEANEAFLADPEAIARAEADGDRWRAVMDAEQAVGAHGVVLPVALAQAILDVLQGRENALTTLSPDLPAKMLQSALNQAERRGQS